MNDPIRLGIFGAFNSGKSALANLLVGKKVFESKRTLSGQFVTKEIKSATMTFNGREIVLFDTPTISKIYVSKDLKGLLNDGLHAFIICISAERITKDIQQEYRIMWDIFRFEQTDPVIVVFTHVDSSCDWESLLQNSPKEIKALYAMFKQNCFFIDNNDTEGVDEKRAQRNKEKINEDDANKGYNGGDDQHSRINVDVVDQKGINEKKIDQNDRDNSGADQSRDSEVKANQNVKDIHGANQNRGYEHGPDHEQYLEENNGANQSRGYDQAPDQNTEEINGAFQGREDWHGVDQHLEDKNGANESRGHKHRLDQNVDDNNGAFQGGEYWHGNSENAVENNGAIERRGYGPGSNQNLEDNTGANDSRGDGHGSDQNVEDSNGAVQSRGYKHGPDQHVEDNNGAIQNRGHWHEVDPYVEDNNNADQGRGGITRKNGQKTASTCVVR